jgi:hypothetical protein
METARLGLSLFGDTRCAAARHACSLKPASIRSQGPNKRPRLNNPMKTIYASPFICLFLVGFTAQAQVSEVTSTIAGSAPALVPSAAEVAVLEAASNAVQGATILLLPDQPMPANQGAPAGVQRSVALTGAAVTAGVPIQEASSNGQTTVRFVYQTGPATVASTTSMALGAAQPLNSPQPMDSLGGCVRAGSGLVSWWQAEGNADDSAGSNPGQTPNDIAYVAGEVGQAFNFNGVNQSVQIPYSSGMATASFSVEAWVNPAHQISSQAFVFGQGYGRQLVVRPGSGGVTVAFFVTDLNGSFYGVTSTRAIPIGQWTHLAGTWDGTNLKLFLNGDQDRNASLQLSAIGNSGCPFSIGGANNSCGSSGQYFPGWIDEVSYYDRALFAGEINAIYLAGSAGKCKTAPVCAACPASAVSWWPGEGDAGDVVGGHPGTLENGASFTNGIVGQAFSFNGTNQSVEVRPPLGTLSGVFSVEAWVNAASQPAGQAFIFGQAYGRQLVARPGNRGLGIAWAISSDPYTWHEVDSSGQIPTNEWTHLVGTWDGASLNLYINGALDQHASVSANAWDAGCGFSIGGANDTCGASGEYFHGLIDEPTYYNQALSAGDVQALYNAGSVGKCPTIPTSWLIHYFGTNYQNEPYAAVTADADGDGVSNLQEYLGGTDPNKIRFFLSLTNQYVNMAGAPVQLNVLGGVPSYFALLVNDTNAADVNWQPFTSTSLWVPTPTNGDYVIAVGLRGLPTDATQSWQSVTILRDITPLILALTNLPAFSGSRPFIDPAGYATRGLSAVTWSVVDGNGLTNNGKGVVVAKGWNLADQFHTTNWFQCLDLALALGTNSISIQAVDWAGNVAITNFAYVFDTNGDTTPPALTLRWPQDKTQVSGNNFTVQAWMDDDTATATLQYTDTGGIVQTMNGLVERGGNVWVEGVPLAQGTNLFALTATDAAGNMSTTNFSVVQSSVALTVAPLSQDQMKYGSATVMVTVGNSASAVTVNGIPGTSSDGQSWQVDNVPLPPGGTVTLQAAAQMGDGSTVQTLLEEEREPVVFTQTCDYTVHYTLSANRPACEGTWTAERDIPFHWVRESACAATFTYTEFDPCTGNTAKHEDALTWPADHGYLPSLPGQRAYNDYLNGQLWHSFTEGQDPPPVERVDISTSSGSWPSNYNASWSESSDVEIRLFTGGKASRQHQGLFDLSASLAYANNLDTAVSDWCANTYWGLFLWLGSPPVAVPSTNITLGALGPLGSDGHLWTVQPDNKEVIITPRVSSCTSDSALAASPIVADGTRGDKPGEQKYKLRIYSGNQDITDTNVTALVGQMITLSCALVPSEGSPPITNVLWTIPSTALSNFFVSADGMQTNGYPVLLTDQQKTSNTVRFCWVDRGAKPVTCKVSAAGQEWAEDTAFYVKRPSATLTATIQTGVEVWDNVLRFGNSAFAGITFMVRDKDTEGDWQYFQVGHQLARYQSGVDGSWSRAEGQGLDTVYPNPSDRDRPFTTLPSDAALATATGTYTTYIAFRPTPVDVLVPIREITWSWDGRAVTNGVGEWVGGGPTPPEPHDREAPPTVSWTNNIMSTLNNRVPE